MTDRAPGQDAPKHEASCYNCGSKDHFVFACPEPTRSQPAGLEAFRQRQAANQIKGSSGNASHGNRSKGPIITRYAPPPPPPPGTGPLPPGYSPWVNGAPPPGPVPYSQTAPPGLPPQPVAYPPLPSGPPALYSSYPPAPAPPPSQQGGYGPSYAPPVPSPIYSHYGPSGPPSGPPPQSVPPQYAQAGPYGLPVYGQPYAPPPPNPAYPPTPQPYYSGPSPPAYLPYAPPPPASYPQGAYSPPNGPPYTPDSQYPPSLPPPPPPAQWNQGSGNRNQHHDRGPRRNKDHRDRGRGRGHHGQQKVSLDSNRRSASVAKDSPIASTSTPKSDLRDERATPVDDTFEWELETIFTEAKTKDADPVGRPLPSEYNDDPTIPPAFDAKCIKSEFFSETEQEVFIASIRDSKDWAYMRNDPVFRTYRGMIKRRFPDHHHEYFVYDLAHLQSEPSDDEFSYAPQEDRSRSKRTRDEYRQDQDRDVKRHKPLSGAMDTPLRSRRDNYPGSAERDVTDALYDSLNEQPDRLRPKDDRSIGPYDSTLRHDSGYQSAQSGDRRQDNRGEAPSSYKSPPHRDNGRSRSSSRPGSRNRSPGPRKMAANPHSYDNDASDSDDSSQMSDIEYELLGLDRPTKKEKKKKELKQTPKRRRIKVNDAFSRRW